MTENEIIEILQTEKACVTRAMKNECNRDCYNCDLCEEGKDILTVYDAVINALDEIQQYRAIGTVKGYEDAIKSSMEYYNLMKEYKAKVQDFEAIGTVEELKNLKEKSEAKKPEYAPTDDSCLYSQYVCPNCYIRLPNFRRKYCQCGQKLDWQ